MRNWNRIFLILISWYLLAGVLMSIFGILTLYIFSPEGSYDLLTNSSRRWGELAPFINIFRLILWWPGYLALVILYLRNLMIGANHSLYLTFISFEIVIAPLLSVLLVKVTFNPKSSDPI